MFGGTVRVKMDRLPPESQEQLKKMGTDHLRAKLTKAGYEEAQVFDMGRTELLDAMAKAMFNEELMQEASQHPSQRTSPVVGRPRRGWRRHACGN